METTTLEYYAIQLKNIIDSEDDILEKEANMHLLSEELMNSVWCMTIQMKENEVKSTLSSEGYKAYKKEERTVQYAHGRMTFVRTPFKKDKNDKPFFPADEWLELGKYQRNSPGFTAKIMQIAPDITSYEKTSRVINQLTTNTVSRSTVMRAVKLYGKRADEYHKHQEVYPEVIENKDKKKVDKIYIEGDAVCFKKQNGEMQFAHVFILHDGVETLSNNRKRSKNMLYFVDIRRKKARDRLKSYLQTHYDMKNIMVIANSDGGSGYEEAVFRDIAGVCNSFEYFIDRYHVSRKLEERVQLEEFIPLFQQAINSGELNKLKMVFDTYESNLETEEQFYHSKKLKNYLIRHWKHLASFTKRGYNIVKEGIGIMESQLRHFTYRLKHCGRHWGKGLNGMAQLLASQKNGDFKQIYLRTWKSEFSLDDSLRGNMSNRLDLRDMNKFTPHVGVKHGRLTLPDKKYVR